MTEPTVCDSRYAFAETVAALVKAIEEGGGTVFATIDQARAAKSVGLELRPTTLLVFGNPRAGTPLMEAFPLAALDLPLKLLVWQESDSVKVAYVPVETLARRYGIVGKDALLAGLTRSIDALAAGVARAR